MTFLDSVHSEWLKELEGVRAKVEEIENSFKGSNFNPKPQDVFRAFQRPLTEVSVVIFGQDPYPTSNHAMGLAFSVPVNVRPLPMTLANIFRELHEDMGCDIPLHGDLTPWANQGVALINRILTVPQGKSGGHANFGWEIVTNEVARILGERDVIAILWGNYAQQLAQYFQADSVISSPHPSPLSAYRGFFGSRPFSKTNQLLANKSRRVIDWSLP